MKYLLLALFLSGCTVSVVDKRVTREELAAAFKQRDDAIEVLAEKIGELTRVIEPRMKKKGAK